jgi:hypothetical protein
MSRFEGKDRRVEARSVFDSRPESRAEFRTDFEADPPKVGPPEISLHSHRLSQVAGLIHVMAQSIGDVVSEQLYRNGLENRIHCPFCFGQRQIVIADRFELRIVACTDGNDLSTSRFGLF